MPADAVRAHELATDMRSHRVDEVGQRAGELELGGDSELFHDTHTTFSVRYCVLVCSA